MKERNTLFNSLLLALATSIQTTQAVQPGDLRAPIPQFMNQEQLAHWHAEQKAPRAQRAQPAETRAQNGIQYSFSIDGLFTHDFDTYAWQLE